MWDKLTVGQFITLYDIEVNGNLNIIEKQQKMLAVIEGKDESEYDNYKYRDLMQEYGKKLSFFDQAGRLLAGCNKKIQVLLRNARDHRRPVYRYPCLQR